MAEQDTGEPLFPRGQTASNTYGTATVSLKAGSTVAGDFEDWVGAERWFPDVLWNTTGRPRRSAKPVLCRVIRNLSITAMFPKKLCQLGPDKATPVQGAKELGRTYGYARLQDSKGYLVDEFLPVAGAPINDLFWIVIEGLATAMSSDASIATIVTGSAVMAATAAASTGATTGADGGKICGITFSQTGLTLAGQILNIVGFAMSTCISNVSNTDILVNVNRY